jgi:hypothetical protein
MQQQYILLMFVWGNFKRQHLLFLNNFFEIFAYPSLTKKINEKCYVISTAHDPISKRN